MRTTLRAYLLVAGLIVTLLILPSSDAMAIPIDADGDGWLSDVDCDDADPLVFPGALEFRDGKDNDCDSDGKADEGAISAGEIVISEIHYDPSLTPDETGEWIEVFNPTNVPVNLRTWTLSDQPGPSQEQTTIAADVIVPPLGSVVLCANGDPDFNGGVTCDYQYGAFTLSNTSDEVILTFDALLVDEVDYNETAGWPPASGASLMLLPGQYDDLANDAAGSWAATPNDPSFTLPSGDEATPNEINPRPDGAPEVVAVSPGNGLDDGGDTIQILGSGFSGATTVEVGGTACTSWQVLSDHEITCTTPAHAVGVVGVTVQTSAGSSTLASAHLYTGEGTLGISTASLDRPASTSTDVGVPTEPLYGRVDVGGITGGACPAGGSYPPSQLIAEVGYGPLATDPGSTGGWLWRAAQCDDSVGGDVKEFAQTLTIPATGIYSVAYRFSADGGVNYAYADLTGIGDGLATANLGVISVGVDSGIPVPALGGGSWLLAALLAAFGTFAIRRSGASET